MQRLMSWHAGDPARWQHEQELASRYLTDSSTQIDENRVASIRGTFVLRLPSSHKLDQFQVRIEYPETFPHCGAHPDVFLECHHETWFCTIDGHIKSDWSLCLYVALESGLDFAKPDALEGLFAHLHTFLIRERVFQEQLRNAKLQFDFSRSSLVSVSDNTGCLRTAVLRASGEATSRSARLELVEARHCHVFLAVLPPSDVIAAELRSSLDPGLPAIHPVWPGPERAHGFQGLIDVVIEHGGLERDDPCVCGSGRTYGECHYRLLNPEVQSAFAMRRT
jgi:hypothetical protein